VPPSVTLVSHAPAAAAAIAWWRGDHRQISVIVKASFAVAPGGAASPAPGAIVLAKDQHYDHDPGRSVEAPGDLAPFKSRTDVALIGHAHAPGGREIAASGARLAIYGAAGDKGPALLDRALHVVGDRNRKAPWSARPFTRMPLAWERAAGSPGTDNPVGRSPIGEWLPNLVDPADPARPACFAPLSSYWPSVRRRLPAGLRRDIDAREPRLPEAFDWQYYQRAPEEQRIPYLLGDEWIVLDGMHPSLARLAFRLPGARAMGTVVDASGRRSPLAFVLDTLLVDVDRMLVTETFRAVFGAAAAQAEGSIQLFAGIEIPPGKLVFPETAPISIEMAEEPEPPTPRRAESAPDGALPRVSPLSPEAAAAIPSKGNAEASPDFSVTLPMKGNAEASPDFSVTLPMKR
jgi:hypothetical protein